MLNFYYETGKFAYDAEEAFDKAVETMPGRKAFELGKFIASIENQDYRLVQIIGVANYSAHSFDVKIFHPGQNPGDTFNMENPMIGGLIWGGEENGWGIHT